MSAARVCGMHECYKLMYGCWGINKSKAGQSEMKRSKAFSKDWEHGVGLTVNESS